MDRLIVCCVLLLVAFARGKRTSKGEAESAETSSSNQNRSTNHQSVRTQYSVACFHFVPRPISE